MAVALVASSTSGTTDAQTSSRTCPVPAGAAATHVAVLELEIWLDTSTDPTITWPAGFTQIGYVESATDGFTRLYLALKVLSGADSGNYSMSWSGSYWNQAQCTLWSGVDNTTSLDVAAASAVTASNRNHAAAALTTVTNGCGMVFATANENNATATAPTGYTQQQTANYLKTYTKIATTAGSESITAGANPWSTATVKVGLLVALRPAGAGGNSTAANPATETDTAQPVGHTRTTTAAVATETDTAQAAGRTRTTTAAPALETDTAQPVGAPSSTPAGTALETDQAQPAGRTRVTAAAAALETDTAQAIVLSGSTAAGTALEVDAAQPVGRTRTSTLATATELDTAQPAGRTRLTTAAPALETDLALAAATTRYTPVGTALEVDTAGTVTGPVLDLVLTGVVEPGRFLVWVENPWQARVEPGPYMVEVER